MAKDEKRSDTVYLDGSTLEGGGQLVRNAIALSALTSIPITVSRIRASGRGKPGLKASHAAAVKFLAEMCDAEVTGGDVGSSTLIFSPRVTPNDPLESIDTNEGGYLKSAQSSNEQGNPVKARSTEVEGRYMKSEYSIRLSTPGSIFLIFQALYPYLLSIGNRLPDQSLKLDITGGTNVSQAPSYDYISQVLIPNFRKLGFPNLSANLHSRGWATGPINLGSVTFRVQPLSTEASNGITITTEDHLNHLMNTTLNPNRRTRHVPGFPSLDLNCYERGVVTQVDITVLAPDVNIGYQRTGNMHDNQPTERQPAHFTAEDLRSGILDSSEEHGEPITARKFLEVETHRSVFRALKSLPSAVVSRCATALDPGSDLLSQTAHLSVPITVHTSEVTYHRTHIYLLLVAHTSKGFRLGTDALFGGQKIKGVERTGGRSRHSNKVKRDSKNRASAHSSDEGDLILTLRELVNCCVTKSVEEIQHDLPGVEIDRLLSQDSKPRKPCVDVFMRDQLVIFEALGKSQNLGQSKHPRCAVDVDQEFEEDKRYWSLHTKTAMWVCEKILGV